MHVLIPADPFSPTTPDEAYASEWAAFRARGFGVSLMSFEDFEAGAAFKARPAIPPGATVVYRGWMLTPEQYDRLHASVAQGGAHMLTPVPAYRQCHYLPAWYPQCEDLTPRTVFCAEDADFHQLLSRLDWPGFFVKDYVKSLTTSRGSAARTPDDVKALVALLKHYRGGIEGGLCIREFVSLRQDSEQRFFVLNGQPHAAQGEPPAIVRAVAGRIDSPFYSVDVAWRTDGDPIIIELGDGQVSDRKAWAEGRFVEVFGEP